MTPNSKFKDSRIVSFPAIIKIKPYKENPEFYMVYFENMGIAFYILNRLNMKNTIISSIMLMLGTVAYGQNYNDLFTTITVR